MDWLGIFERASSEAKKAVLGIYGKPEADLVVGRRRGHPTLRMDQVAEEAIISTLREAVDEDFILVTEESGELQFGGDSRFVIVCDPLDGSHNAKIGLPIFSVSLALLDLPRKFSDTRLGYVESLLTEDTFYAERGRGAFRNGELLGQEESGRDMETMALDVTSLAYLKRITPLLKGVEKVRMIGCASLALCMVASRTFSSYIFAGLKRPRTLDVSAAYLVAVEAGCVVTDDRGRDVRGMRVGLEDRRNIVASVDVEVHRQVLEMLK